MAYTGYRIDTYIDVNPKSPTYNTTREERVADSTDCPAEGSSWVVVAEYCELDAVSGTNTGYFVTDEMDTSSSSPTYMEHRITKEWNREMCPEQSTDPLWEELDGYCEQMVYLPSGVSGNTGYKMALLRDGNRYSPTWGEEKWDRIASSGCPAPSTAPEIEEVSSSCVMVDCSGTTATNGYKNVTGIDKNVYSPTYLSSVTDTIVDTETCPDNCGGGGGGVYVFTWSDGSTAMTYHTSYLAKNVTFGVSSYWNGGHAPWHIIVEPLPTDKLDYSFVVSIPQNDDNSGKTYSYSVIQLGSEYMIYLDIEQTAYGVIDYDEFRFDDTDETTRYNTWTSDSAMTFNIISHISGTPTSFMVAQDMYSNFTVTQGTQSGFEYPITITPKSSSISDTVTELITFTQVDGSYLPTGRSLRINCTQRGNETFVFQFTGTTEGTAWAETELYKNFEQLGDAQTFNIESTKNGSNCSWGVGSKPDWATVTVDTTANTCTISCTPNPFSIARNGYVYLEQSLSMNRIFVKIIQSGKSFPNTGTLKIYGQDSYYEGGFVGPTQIYIDGMMFESHLGGSYTTDNPFNVPFTFDDSLIGHTIQRVMVDSYRQQSPSYEVTFEGEAVGNQSLTNGGSYQWNI